MRNERRIVVLVVALGMVLSARAASAAKKGKYDGSTGTQGPVAPPRPTSNPALAPAQAEVKKAQAELEAARKKSESTFLTSPDYTAALAAQKQAQSDYEAAAAPVRATVHATPEYQAALAEKEQASKRLHQLQSSAGGQGDLSGAATGVMSASQKMTRLEAAALADDPKAAAAKEALTAATAKATSMHADFEKSAKSEPEYVAAQKALEDARQKLAEVEKQK